MYNIAIRGQSDDKHRMFAIPVPSRSPTFFLLFSAIETLWRGRFRRLTAYKRRSCNHHWGCLLRSTQEAKGQCLGFLCVSHWKYTRIASACESWSHRKTLSPGMNSAVIVELTWATPCNPRGFNQS